MLKIYQDIQKIYTLYQGIHREGTQPPNTREI